MANSRVFGGTLHACGGEPELAADAVEREDVRALADGEDERSVRTVERVARGELPHARLQERRRIRVQAVERRRLEREDRADRDIGVDVRRAVERIDGDAAAARPGSSSTTVVELLGRQRGHGARGEARDDHVVGDDVERLLHVAAAVIAARGAERAGQRAGADELRDGSARAGDGTYRRSDAHAMRILSGPVDQYCSSVLPTLTVASPVWMS